MLGQGLVLVTVAPKIDGRLVAVAEVVAVQNQVLISIICGWLPNAPATIKIADH